MMNPTPAPLTLVSNPSARAVAGTLAGLGIAAVRARLGGLRKMVVPALWLATVAGLGFLYLSSGHATAPVEGGAGGVCLLEQILDVIGPSLEFDRFFG